MNMIPLKAGPLSMSFDIDSGFLRWVRCGQRELVRGVFAAIRDHNWDTIPVTVTELEQDIGEDEFDLRWWARSRHESIRFDWRGRLTGTREGVVRYRFDGVARSTFHKNRIGLCVLHPIKECNGHACRVEHCDGGITAGRFPEVISPHQPFRSIRSITHAVCPGIDVKVTMLGEEFEMEDQRNWTDASYKIYSTPLDLPFPVPIDEGAKVEHEVVIELIGDQATAPPATPIPASDAILVRVNWDRAVELPQIGFSFPKGQHVLPEAVSDSLQEANCQFLRYDLHLEHDDWRAQIDLATSYLELEEFPLQLAVFVRDIPSDRWSALLESLGPLSSMLHNVLVFHPDAKATPCDLARAAAESLHEFDSLLPIGVGTDAYFAELNRNRPPVGEGMFVTCSVNPQVHAFDNVSLAENLSAQRCVVDSAHAIFECKVAISPITLRPRFNPNATSVPEGESSEPESDPRQASGFAAAWTIGSLANLATHPQVECLTYFETHGPRGIMHADGTAYPMCEVFRHLDRVICPTTVFDPLSITAVGIADHLGPLRLLLGNVSHQEQRVEIQSYEEESIRRFSLIIPAESILVVELENDD